VPGGRRPTVARDDRRSTRQSAAVRYRKSYRWPTYESRSVASCRQPVVDARSRRRGDRLLDELEQTGQKVALVAGVPAVPRADDGVGSADGKQRPGPLAELFE